MGQYDDEIATAQELIAEAGMMCEWTKEIVAPTDPDRPWLGGEPTPLHYHPMIAFLPATDGASGFGMTKFKDGVANFSTYGLMGAVSFIPQVGDKLTRGNQPLVIVDIDELKPAEDVLLYVLSIE